MSCLMREVQLAKVRSPPNMDLSIELDGADSRFSSIVPLPVQAVSTRSEVTAPHAEIQATTPAVVMEIRNRPSVARKIAIFFPDHIDGARSVSGTAWPNHV